jgi:NADH-quinone oxidoreductase subunit C
MRRLDFYLVFVSSVHLDPDMEIIYQFANYHGPCRTLGRAFAHFGGVVPTISDIFHGANWHERETRDMFGVLFSGHPFLEPLLLPEEDKDLKPLLKKPAALKGADKVRRVDETTTLSD